MLSLVEDPSVGGGDNSNQVASTSDDSFFVVRFPLSDVSGNQKPLELRGVTTMSNIRRFVRTFPELEFRQRDHTMRSILARKGVQSDRAFISFYVSRHLPWDGDAINTRGSSIIMQNFNTMLRMETNMWVLSTLGGGYSALADCGLRQFAEKALEVSRIQIELARNLGDQVMLARCYIYVGYAFTQLGRLCDAFKIFIYVRSLARRLKSELLDGLTIALFIKIDQAALKQDDPITSTSKFKYFHEKFC